mmetsp:Transcript_33894/g.97520  ORF Transcript_33894/g.97520 Transcript_33894/m.97520 type:complete len:270 (+) Transcript_33894:1085-1894(+)
MCTRTAEGRETVVAVALVLVLVPILDAALGLLWLSKKCGCHLFLLRYYLLLPLLQSLQPVGRIAQTLRDLFAFAALLPGELADLLLQPVQRIRIPRHDLLQVLDFATGVRTLLGHIFDPVFQGRDPMLQAAGVLVRGLVGVVILRELLLLLLDELLQLRERLVHAREAGLELRHDLRHGAGHPATAARLRLRRAPRLVDAQLGLDLRESLSHQLLEDIIRTSVLPQPFIDHPHLLRNSGGHLLQLVLQAVGIAGYLLAQAGAQASDRLL